MAPSCMAPALQKGYDNYRGCRQLYALFLREEVPDRWDLLVAAPWVESDREGALNYFVDEIKSFLGVQYLTVLSRIVFVDPNDPAVQSLNRSIKVEHGSAEVRDTDFFGLSIKHAYIITSKLPAAPVAS